jgi:hypothetical protein
MIPASLGMAQNEPSGGDTPLNTGDAVILSQQAPPAHVAGTAQIFLRAVIIPMNTPDGPVRIRFEKPIDLARLRASPGSLSTTARSENATLAGTWRWEDANELRFLPNPGSVSRGDYLTIQMNGSVPVRGQTGMPNVSTSLSFIVEDFQMGSKVASSPVTPGNPQFVSFLDSGTRKIGAGPLYVLYDQPVDPTAMAAYFSATCAGQALDIQVSQPSSISFDTMGVYATRNIVAVSFPSLPPDGAVVTLTYPSMVWSTVNYAKQDFTILTEFRWTSSDLEALRSGRAARLTSDWSLGFTNPIDASAFLAAFSITPRPPVLDVRLNGELPEVSIHAEFDVGRLYSLKLDPGFTDMLGNTLHDPLSFAFKSQDLLPVLELPAFSLLLEAGSNRLPIKYRNLKGIEVATWQFPDVASYARALEARGSLGSYDLSKAPSVKVRAADTAMNNLCQADIGIGKEAGLKLIEVRATGRGSENSGAISGRILVQTSNLGISAKVSDGAIFAWVTRIDTAAPVQGARLDLFDANGTSQGTAATAADGTAVIKTSEARGSELDQTLYLSASLAKDASLCRLSNGELSGAWQFNLPGAVKESNPLAAALFTDRGAYRPGETVHLKAFIRDLPEYAGAPDPHLVIHDPRGQEAFNASIRMDAYRGCSWDFAVKDGAPVGAYSASLSLGDYLCSQIFHVEEYRVPTFQVSVTSPDASWSIDTPVRVKAAATYLKGGKLSGRPFTWRVYRQPDTFAPAAFPGYVFSLERDLAAAGTVYDEDGTLNADGEASLSFRPDHPDSYGPMLYIVQAAVTDSDRQNYAGRLSRVVHATSRYVGVRPPSKAIYRAGDTLSFPFIVTDLDGNVVPDAQVQVYLDTVSYDQNTMLDELGRATTYNREVLSSQPLGAVSSDAAPASYTLTLAQTGVYRLRLETQDPAGRTASTAFVVTVSGKGTVAWPRFDMERIDLVLDKASYKAGDKVTMVAQSPFETARGLVTVEANGVLDRYPFTIDKNTPALSFPVKASYAPNAYVSVILIRGRVHWAKDATGFETGAPAYRIGYARLEVDPSAQRMAPASRLTRVRRSWWWTRRCWG